MYVVSGFPMVGDSCRQKSVTVMVSVLARTLVTYRKQCALAHIIQRCCYIEEMLLLLFQSLLDREIMFALFSLLNRF